MLDSGPGKAFARVGLEVVSDDQLATLQILDEGLNLLASGIGAARLGLPPGFYRVQLITPEGRTSSEIVWLPPGQEAVTVRLSAPEPPSGLAGMLVGRGGFQVKPDNNVLVTAASMLTELATGVPILTLAAPSAASLITFLLAANGVASLAPALLKEFGLIALPRSSTSGLRLLVALDAKEKSTPVAEVVTAFRLRAWRQHTSPPSRQAALKANTQNEAVAGFARTLNPGSYWVELNSPQLRLHWIVSIALLPNYDTTLLVEVRSSRDISLTCALTRKQADAKSTEWYLKQTLAQRAMRAGRMDLARQYAESLMDSITEEPLSACLIGYTTLESGASDAGSSDFTATFRERFPTLSDAHFLWATFAGTAELSIRADVETAYRKAAALGTPIFASGLIGLANECESILANPSKQMVLGDDSELKKMVLYRDTLVPGQHLTVLSAQAVMAVISKGSELPQETG